MTGFPYPVPPRLLDAIDDSRVVVLATHENPDADGLGSLLALGLALVAHGRAVSRLTSGPLPSALDSLPGLDRIDAWTGPRRVAADLVVMFDCHRRARLGSEAARIAEAPLVAAIDHHPLDPRGSDVDCLWLVDDAPSASMLVHSLLLALPGTSIDADIATNLYAGLLTDTGGFRHANTTHDALQAAADLVRSGADAAALAELLLYRRRPQAMQLTGEVLGATQYRLGGRVAVMVVDRAVLARTGALLEESENLASQLTGIEGVACGVLMREVEPGAWRVSLRASGHVRVDAIAREFGGGGHHRAAAFTASGSREEVEAELLRVLATAIEDHERGDRT